MRKSGANGQDDVFPAFDGRPMRMLTVVDQFSRLSPLIEPRMRFGGRDAGFRGWGPPDFASWDPPEAGPGGAVGDDS